MKRLEGNQNKVKVKNFPLNFTALLRNIYYSKCREHYGVVITTSHMREEHDLLWRNKLIHNGVNIDTAAILMDYQ